MSTGSTQSTSSKGPTPGKPSFEPHYARQDEHAFAAAQGARRRFARKAAQLGVSAHSKKIFQESRLIAGA